MAELVFRAHLRDVLQSMPAEDLRTLIADSEAYVQSLNPERLRAQWAGSSPAVADAAAPLVAEVIVAPRFCAITRNQMKNLFITEKREFLKVEALKEE